MTNMHDDFGDKNIVISITPEIVREAATAFTDKDLTDEQIVAIQDFVESCIWDSVNDIFDEAFYQIVSGPYRRGLHE